MRKKEDFTLEEAVDEELIQTNIGTLQSFRSPYDAVQALIGWHVSVTEYFTKERQKALDETTSLTEEEYANYEQLRNNIAYYLRYGKTRSYTLNLPRRIGKTTAIKSLATREDIIITPTFAMAYIAYEKYSGAPVYPFDSLTNSTRTGKPLLKCRNIFFDEIHLVKNPVTSIFTNPSLQFEKLVGIGTCGS